MKTLKLSLGMIGLIALGACEGAPQGLGSSLNNSDGTQNGSGSSGGGGSSPSCPITSMTKNGAQGADPARTAYECHFDDDNSTVVFAFYTDTGVYVKFGAGALDFRRWKVDTQACVMTIYIHPAGADLYYIDNVALNGNNSLKQGSLYNVANNTTRTFSNCLYDTSPGF